MMNEQNTHFQEMKTKIQKGLELAYVRLLKEKIKNNGKLVVMRDDKVVILKTPEIKQLLHDKRNSIQK